jgi:hypothetical protein
MVCRRFDGEPEFQKSAIKMNDKTLGQPLTNDSESTATPITWDELVKIVQVGDIVRRSNRNSQITGKEFKEDAQGLFNIMLISREV